MDRRLAADQSDHEAMSILSGFGLAFSFDSAVSNVRSRMGGTSGKQEWVHGFTAKTGYSTARARPWQHDGACRATNTSLRPHLARCRAAQSGVD